MIKRLLVRFSAVALLGQVVQKFLLSKPVSLMDEKVVLQLS